MLSRVSRNRGNRSKTHLLSSWQWSYKNRPKRQGIWKEGSKWWRRVEGSGKESRWKKGRGCRVRLKLRTRDNLIFLMSNLTIGRDSQKTSRTSMNPNLTPRPKTTPSTWLRSSLSSSLCRSSWIRRTPRWRERTRICLRRGTGWLSWSRSTCSWRKWTGDSLSSWGTRRLTWARRGDRGRVSRGSSRDSNR